MLQKKAQIKTKITYAKLSVEIYFPSFLPTAVSNVWLQNLKSSDDQTCVCFEFKNQIIFSYSSSGEFCRFSSRFDHQILVTGSNRLNFITAHSPQLFRKYPATKQLKFILVSSYHCLYILSLDLQNELYFVIRENFVKAFKKK